MTVRTVSINERQEASVLAAAQDAADASSGDSNDKEIEAYQALADIALGLLGLGMPEGREPCHECDLVGEHEEWCSEDDPGVLQERAARKERGTVGWEG